jgi:hypothetical protein
LTCDIGFFVKGLLKFHAKAQSRKECNGYFRARPPLEAELVIEDDFSIPKGESGGLKTLTDSKSNIFCNFTGKIFNVR